MDKVRINISLDKKVAEGIRMAGIRKYGSLRSFSRMIEFLYSDCNTHKNPNVKEERRARLKLL